MLIASTRWKRGLPHRWRATATVAGALSFLLLMFGVLWSPVDVDTGSAALPAAADADADSVRRLLLRGVDDERSTWSCRGGRDSSDGGCLLTPSLLASTAAARPSVYLRTGHDCLAMFRGHGAEIEAARKFVAEETASQHRGGRRPTMSDDDLRLLAAGDCAAFRQSRGYFTRPLSQMEAEFPVAFSILAYDNIPQVIQTWDRRDVNGI